MRPSTLALSLALAGLAAACGSKSPPPLRANALLEARSGSSVAGRVELTEAGGQVRAHVELSGLAPGSEHGFHIHDKGDCSAADASSAGGHYNPAGSVHGRAGIPPHHAGDLPSLIADSRGNVNADVLVDGVTLAPGPTSIVGRSFVVHRDRDDYTTQPAGNSGPRIACGIIVAR
ncbi:MAG TPA: superoxide dismutase family protein [Steroidobacteraceae bacterium]|nr:superoxide dismutase family protein [Steroidobacteraceae bacterium]